MHNVSLSLSVFVAMEIKYDVKTVNALLDQFYEKRRLLILSAPNITDSDYQLQNLMIQVSAGFTRLQVFFLRSDRPCLTQKADCGLDLRRVTVIELLGSPPRETGRIKENLLTTEVVEGLRCVLRLSVVQCLSLLSAG